MDATENQKVLFKAIQSGDLARATEILAQAAQLVDAVDETACQPCWRLSITTSPQLLTGW